MRCYNKSCPMYNEQYEDGCNIATDHVDYDYEDFENVCPDFMPETLPKMRCGNKRCDNYNSSNLSGCTTMTSIAHCPEMYPDLSLLGTVDPAPVHTPQSKYKKIGTEIGRLVDEKQIAYGDSFGKTDKFIELLYPNGVKPYQYSDALALVRIFDKMMRIATKKDAFGESPFKDIAGYAMLGYGKDR